MKVKGIRDIATINRLIRRGAPRTNAQTAAELAHLEHEKARLERELDLWTGNLKRTEVRFKQAQERIAFLKKILAEASAITGEPPAKDAHDDAVQKIGVWSEIKIEY